ncbi:M16 family metallopeptidase [Granulicella mallensis]|uniref:Peptidase M16 domain protein n=1 Tax=Granulicella mallensis (strain ATCC BAA-1857 / DSM 23137 / MP5ACTX8) TaxID=682795 RepID=G8NZZ1_GRAMM|nr:pitrilysin family protein [Granulicella mallensis]AEU35707.1 peptidase M16 domain protein [Granulicella mallensis MP5ACTX8]
MVTSALRPHELQPWRSKVLRTATLAAVTLLFLPGLKAQDKYEQQMESHTTVKVLPNGLTLVLSERHEAPVFSFYTLVDAGSADDPGGQSGLAHMFEHIAFKGTTEVGTTDYPAEKAALDKVEQAYAAYDAEFRKPVGQDKARLASLHQAFEDAVKTAQTYVIPNQFSEIAEENGAVGLNASTAEDSTQYFWSMPSNRLELWAYLESGRIGWPVAREFYKERDVVNEERRMRIDSSSQGRLIEEFLAAAYMAHPYGRPGVGWESDITQVTATEAAAFHSKYYVPSNIVVAVVGDFDTKTALPMLERYFGRIPAGPKPEPLTTIEPPQHAERTVVLREATQPIYLEGYHKPDYRDPDDSVYDAITDIFSNGRTSRLYRSLVRDQKIALVAEGFSGFPGNKFPGLFAFYALPQRGHTSDELRTAIHKELDTLKTTDVSDAELERFKTRARADLLRGLGDNAGLASQLAQYQTSFGDWRVMFQELAKIDAVTKADIRRVANKTFVENNRTSARIDFQAPTATPVAAGNGGAK